MRIAEGSHVDHGLRPEHIGFVLGRFGGRSEFFAEMAVLPDELPPLKSALYGPLMGDAPVPEADVVYAFRPGRAWPSRVLAVDRPLRTTRVLTVIGADVLFTAYGGPLAPREPDDPSLDAEGKRQSEAFWRQHALVLESEHDRAMRSLRARGVLPAVAAAEEGR